MTDTVSIDKIRKAFALALHPNTGKDEQKAAWIGALRLCLAHGFRTFDDVVAAASPEAAGDQEETPPDGWYMAMPFGKHKGMTLGTIAMRYPDYLEWLVGQTFRSSRLNEAAKDVYYWKENHGSH